MSGPDMSAAAITERLRIVARLTDLRPARRLDWKVDMSPEAITLRLRQVAELNRLCSVLGRAGEARTSPRRED